MTLAEYVKSLAIRIGLLEKGGSGGDVTKEYVDSQDTKLGNRITNLNTKVNGIRSDLTDAQGDISTLQSDVSVLQGDVTTLKDDVENIMDAIPSKTSDLVNDSGFITASDTIDKAINDENGENIADQFSAINNALPTKASLPNVNNILHTFAVGTWTATDDGYALLNFVSYNGGEIRAVVNSKVNYARLKNNGNAGLFQSFTFPFKKGDRIEIITTNSSVAYLDTNAPSYALGV